MAAAHLVSLPFLLQCFFVFCHTLKHIIDLAIDLSTAGVCASFQLFVVVIVVVFLIAAFNNLCKERAREGEVFCCVKNKRRKKAEKKSQRCGFW